MMQQLIDFFAACPALQENRKSLGANYSGKSDFTLSEEPKMQILYRYKDGSCLVHRMFRAELYVSHLGTAKEHCDTHALYERIRDYVLSAPLPKIPEGEIVTIKPCPSSIYTKSGIFEGLMPFHFSVYIKQNRKGGGLHVSYRV